MTAESPYAAELRAAAAAAEDAGTARYLSRVADKLVRDENLDIDELLLLSVVAMAIQAPDELAGWARSVSRRNPQIAGAVDLLVASTRRRQPWAGHARPAAAND